MSHRVSKAMRRYVRRRYADLSPEPLYQLVRYGERTIVLSPECQRFYYQGIKSAYKKAHKNN